MYLKRPVLKHTFFILLDLYLLELSNGFKFYLLNLSPRLVSFLKHFLLFNFSDHEGFSSNFIDVCPYPLYLTFLEYHYFKFLLDNSWIFFTFSSISKELSYSLESHQLLKTMQQWDCSSWLIKMYVVSPVAGIGYPSLPKDCVKSWSGNPRHIIMCPLLEGLYYHQWWGPHGGHTALVVRKES